MYCYRWKTCPTDTPISATPPRNIHISLKKRVQYATVDLGHANTNGDVEPFLSLENISYYHLSDNNGEKDQHLSLGEGNLNLNLLKGIDNVIIELNNYENVLKVKKFL